MKKTHWKKLINPDYIGAYTLLGSGVDELTLTVKCIKSEQVKGPGGKAEMCPVMYFQEEKNPLDQREKQKPMVLNTTNSQMLESNFGSSFVEDWAGKKVTIFATKTKFGKDEVDCLRIKPVEQGKVKLLIGSETFEKCVAGLKNGYSIEDVTRKYDVSDDVRDALIDRAI